jgi:hypothetical protein
VGDRLAAIVLALGACGRIEYDPLARALADGSLVLADASLASDGPAMTDGSLVIVDGSPGCADIDLGSATGESVASGTTSGQGNDYSACSGEIAPDVAFRWVAPSAGSFTFDVCSGGDALFDTVLSARDGSCEGPQLACDDDSCGGVVGLKSRITVQATAGQEIIVVVDGLFGPGSYVLAINPG